MLSQRMTSQQWLTGCAWLNQALRMQLQCEQHGFAAHPLC
jgi:hypothetical protein